MFPDWMGNGWQLTLFTGMALVLSHLISYFLRDRKIRFWLAYTSLFLGGAALLTSFHTALGAVNAAKAEFSASRLDRAGAEVRREIQVAENYLCNHKGRRSLDSPPDFDKIERERDEACQMFKQIGVYAESNWDMEKAPFAPPDVGLASVTDVVFRHSVERLEQVQAEHRAALQEFTDLRPQPWLFWTAVEPFVIAASWSMGLALIVPPRKRRSVRRAK